MDVFRLSSTWPLVNVDAITVTNCCYELPTLILSTEDIWNQHYDPVHATQEEFENGGFLTLKTQQTFSIDNYAGGISKSNNRRTFGLFVFKESSGWW